MSTFAPTASDQRISEKISLSGNLVNRGMVALTGDKRAEGEGLEPPRATARPPAGPPPEETEPILPNPPQDVQK